jgi:putative RecB family exonuclease
LARAWKEISSDPEFVELGLNDDDAAAFLADSRKLVDNYFRLEDPTAVHTVGVELGVEIHNDDGLRLRGIIDRLDIGPDGALTVVDYKTGRAPSERYEHGRMGGVQTYALLCEQALGRAPVEVRLLHLRDPVTISAISTPQTIRGQQRRTTAVWDAISRACISEDFRPKVGPLCQFCHFKPSCPAFGAA